MSSNVNIMDLNIEELETYFVEKGLQKFRAKQVFQWIHKGAASTEEMTNLPKDLREKLKPDFDEFKLKQKLKLVSKIDGTAKYIFQLFDGNIIESVLMKYKHGNSVCISSQVGCRMGCTFCASTGVGFIRNLTPGELLDQVIEIQRDSGERVSNIVLMGIGEPLDNYDNVLKFLRIVNHPEGINIGSRHISLSTCGLVPKILELAKENIQLTLSISLHAPNDTIRSRTMPVNQKYSIDKLIEACKIYTEETKRRITFEYALIDGVNDSAEQATELAHKIKGMLCHVNLIPVNSIENGKYRKSNKDKIENFKNILGRFGVEATVRRELGSDISAACGQLRRSVMKEIDT